MASRSAKESVINKLGVKLGGAHKNDEISELRKENDCLKKALHEMSRLTGEPTDSESNKLLERILALETLREKNSQQILAKDQEIAALRKERRLGSDGILVGLRDQLSQEVHEAEMKEKLFQSLKQETEDVKNKLVAVSAKCQELENRDNTQVSVSEVDIIQEHLRDALEKNRQWLVYDQQREAYVSAVLTRTFQLEQQLKQASESLARQHRDASSEGDVSVSCQTNHKETLYAMTFDLERRATEVRQRYEGLLQEVQGELQTERERTTKTQRQITQLHQQYEDRERELREARQRLQEEHLSNQKATEEQRRRSRDRVSRMQVEVENIHSKLEEERQRSAELLQQVNLLQKSLLNQQEDQRRILVLEEQIQQSAKDLEDEKRDNQHLRRQLHKVLRELRKAKDYIVNLELECQKAQREADTCEQSAYLSVDKADTPSEKGLSSPTKAPCLLDESFLECPNCRVQYPTSRHRELLLHVDQCFG
ncbi:centrosomal protein of 55 kDa-like [Chanos chanos]|uniref:Centrosomal protein of 55 kDa-like n=1 Tax=Chanos chanos TaxID=29144 RepID=A0A6J2V8F8_CHACN|nr:centrosomal protein of 55 kDa-like [Chanos chanos]